LLILDTYRSDRFTIVKSVGNINHLNLSRRIFSSVFRSRQEYLCPIWKNTVLCMYNTTMQSIPYGSFALGLLLLKRDHNRTTEKRQERWRRGSTAVSTTASHSATSIPPIPPRPRSRRCDDDGDDRRRRRTSLPPRPTQSLPSSRGGTTTIPIIAMPPYSCRCPNSGTDGDAAARS
jgi:hypothetical protein